jgi:membrane associated rhomboid family serine protease
LPAETDFMQQQAVFGRRGVNASQRTARADSQPAVTDGETIATPQAPLTYADLDGSQRLAAAIPMLTVAMVSGLAIIFQLQLLFAFDVGAHGAISTDALVAEGADARNLTIAGGEVWRVLLAPLLHSSYSHLLGNCLALLLVGVLLEPTIGRGWFAGIFAASAIGGEVGSLVGNPPWMPGVGASGAITGLLAAAFVMSFSAETQEEGRSMRRRAMFFGVPALAPLIWGAHDHVNYYAHLGGAIVGGAIALAIDQTWDRVSFRPAFHRHAAWTSLGLFALCLPAAALTATQYQGRRADAAHFIPIAALDAKFDELARRAPEFQSRYPDDPMTRIVTGVYDAEQGRLSEGEAELRTAMTMETPTRPWMERALHATARGFLAILLKSEGRHRDAERLADRLCSSSDNANVTEMLRKAKLCGEA